MKLPGLLFFLSFTLCAASTDFGKCAFFPPDNVWNVRVDMLPLDPQSSAYVNTIGPNLPLHPDFGTGSNGIPFVTVPGSQPKVRLSFQYADESDPGPYPIPPDAPIEGGSQSNGDRHVLVVNRDNCILYEVFSSYPQTDGSWKAGSGAIFILKSNQLRTDTSTSADAAGLPILPGLVRYEEVASGEIRHAIRFTVPKTRRAYVWPGRHFASSLTDAAYPPMGQRFRLKANFDITKFSPETQVILRALKKYGMFLADNGSAWFISGAPDDRWSDDRLGELRAVHGSDFEAVDESSLVVDSNSGEVKVNPSNAASFMGGPIAAGELVTIAAPGIGPPDPAGLILNADGAVDTELSGTHVWFDNQRAPLLYVSRDQINAVAPYAIAGKQSVTVKVEYNGGATFRTVVPVAATAPAIFTVDGVQAAALNQDYSVNSPDNPAASGTFISLFATGGGVTDPPGVDGRIASETAGPGPSSPLAVSLACAAVIPQYAGWAPRIVDGVLQINVQIPSGTPAGQVPVLLTIGDRQSQSDVTVSVK